MEQELREVIVVGARCAGSATALLLARAGHDVLVLDRAGFPSDVHSTHAFARGGVVQLKRWGLLAPVMDSGAPPVREVAFHRDGGEVVRTIKDRAGVDHLVAPRRYVLDALLVEAARAAGAEVRERVTVTGLLRADDGRVLGVTTRDRRGQERRVRSRVVVGADGLRSRVAQWVGAPVTEHFAADVTTFSTYVGDVAWTGFEFHLAEDAFSGVFPTHDGEAAVWVSRPDAHLRDVRAAGAHRQEAFVAQLDVVAPHLARRVRRGRISEPVRGAVRLPNHLRVPAGPGWALAGDAGYHRDPITGHGITDAFRDAELLAAALDGSLRDGSPEAATRAAAEYRQARDAAARDTFRLTREIAAFPAPTRMAELQIEYALALDAEAHDLAALPAPPGAAAAA